ncbi:MAG: response regulator [Clostridiales Family XIII bacterium]|jgi:response regulator of citrate/malate metabolism|nr:response regulator [Clostridiales Family XIII bacterium]
MIRTVIVEDDPMVAQINQRYLDEFPMIQVDAVLMDGQKAYDYLLEHEVELVILDVYMPEITGLELLRSMRQRGLAADVIMVTAANDVQQIEEMLRLGIVDYLVKPFEYERFRVAVDKYLVRNGILTSNRTLDQASIDQMIRADDPSAKSAKGLEKGIQMNTLQTILSPLCKEPERHFGCEDLAAHVGLSKVTARRYLNHLMRTGRVECTIDYETGGRPCMKYRYCNR